MDKSTKSDEQEIVQISEQILAARTSKMGLTSFPVGVPQSLEAAYRIQDLSISKWPDRIVGWKVGGIPASWQSKFNDTRLSGPIYAGNVRHYSDSDPIEMPVFADGYAGIEAEFIIELAETDELPSSGLSEQDVRGAIRNIYIGAEIASSPIQRINEYGPTAPISDFGNNSGLIIGQKVENWREIEMSDFPVTVDIDGEVFGPTNVEAGLLGPLGATKFLIEHLKQREYSIPQGTYISSGAITGVHDSHVGANATIEFAGLGSFRLALVSS